MRLREERNYRQKRDEERDDRNSDTEQIKERERNKTTAKKKGERTR